jgi:hypothetical protein
VLFLGVVREFLEMVADGVVIVDACLVRRGKVVECLEENSDLIGISEYSILMPSIPGHVYLLYRRRSPWVFTLVPLGRDFWLLFKVSYYMLSTGRNFNIMMRSLADMSYRVGGLLKGEGRNKNISVIGG